MAIKDKLLDDLVENTADLSLKRKAKKIIREINPQVNDKILEVGCGDAYYPSILARLGNFYIVGLEIDKRVLDTAERNFKTLGILYKRLKKWKDFQERGIYFLHADVNKMPFRDCYFSKIIMSEVAEHLNNDLKGLEEVYRCLKKDGYLVLTVPNWYYPFLWDPLNWILQRIPGNHHVKSGFFAGIWNQHFRLYRPDEIRKVVEKAGFKIEIFEIQTRWCLPFNHYIINLGARMLASGILPKELHSQMNKFEQYKKKKRNPVVSLYYGLARYVDKLNFQRNYSKVGTTIFIKAIKP